MKRPEQASKWIIAVLCMGVLFGCGEDDNAEPNDPGYDYFQTTIGSWVEYEVDSVFVDEQFGGDTVHVNYMLRVIVDTIVTDAQGRQAQRLVRSVLDSTGNWVIRDVWSQYQDNFIAERTEENLRKLCMAFPVRDNRFWDLNVFNTEDELEVTYGEIDQPWSNQHHSFDSTVTVISTYSNNLIDTIIEMERYAKHVGLVEKRSVNTNTQYANGPQTTGHRFYMTVTAYGLP